MPYYDAKQVDTGAHTHFELEKLGTNAFVHKVAFSLSTSYLISLFLIK